MAIRARSREFWSQLVQGLTVFMLGAISPVGQAFADTGNKGHDLLAAKPPSEQARILGQSAGPGCLGTSAFFMGMGEDRSALWSVLCADGESYAVMVTPDRGGTTKALTCSQLQAMSPKVDCFMRLPDDGGNPVASEPPPAPSEPAKSASLPPSPPTVLRGAGNERR